eukprot:5729472-Lingulodinium_polyedra.AAC.1
MACQPCNGISQVQWHTQQHQEWNLRDSVASLVYVGQCCDVFSHSTYSFRHSGTTVGTAQPRRDSIAS